MKKLMLFICGYAAAVNKTSQYFGSGIAECNRFAKQFNNTCP
jgi:hypothetical protein